MKKKHGLALLVLMRLVLKLTLVNAQDTTGTVKNSPVFNNDVYLYGTINSMFISADTKNHMGEYVTIQGKIYNGQFIEKDGLTLLNMGDNHPNRNLTVVIKKRNRAKFGHPETDLIGKMATIKGIITDYKGHVAIKLSNPKNLTVQEVSPKTETQP